MPNKSDILIKNGLVYDGSLTNPNILNIAINGDRIAYMGSEQPQAELVMDAEGLAVSPGFIDAHAHSDFTIVSDPRAYGKISQGVTTEINGNCGLSAAPLFGKALERREDDLRELGIAQRWNTFGEYLNILGSQGIGVNVAYLAGHGNIRGSVIGYHDHHSSQSEMAEMKRLLLEAIDEGAIGLSTGLIYPPGIYSDTDELIGLSSVLRRRDLIYTSHMRSEGDRLQEAVEEVISIGVETGVKVHISHIKTAGERNWGKADAIIGRLNEARMSGLRLTCDRYPYIASGTDLDAILPSWTFAGGNEEELKRLSDPFIRRRIEEEMKDQFAAPGYWDKVIVSSVVSDNNRWMEGKTVRLIGEELGISSLDAFFRVLIEERLRVAAIYMSMSENNLRKFLSLPFCLIGSDSSARCFDGPTASGKPHPRTYGTFSRIFGRYVREEGLMTISEAVHKSTMLTAETFGLKGRGRIREGYFADIVVFNPAKISDTATFDKPFIASEGIRHVLINGGHVLLDGKCTGKLAGRVIKH